MFLRDRWLSIIHYPFSIAAQLHIGGLAQLARAPALQAGGQRFESVILHTENRIDAVNPISDTLMADAVNPEPDTRRAVLKRSLTYCDTRL